MNAKTARRRARLENRVQWQRDLKHAMTLDAGRKKFEAFIAPARDFATDLEFAELAAGRRKLRRKHPPKAGTTAAGRPIPNMVREIPQDFKPAPEDLKVGRIPGALVSVPRVMSGETRRRRRGRRAVR